MRNLIVLCALIVVAVACTDIRCEVNSDCGERARCTMNRCVSDCRQDRDCQDGSVCSINGECVAPPSSTTDAQVGDDRALANVATMPDAPGVDSAPMDTPIEASSAPDGATDVGDDGVGDAPIEEASHAEVGADVGMDSPSEDADAASLDADAASLDADVASPDEPVPDVRNDAPGDDASCAAAATRACYSGRAGTLGVGRCRGGMQTCGSDGAWGPCVGEVLPAGVEACNGVDDDCDGAVDGPSATSACTLANATALCRAGACQVNACSAGFGDCDGTAGNGCEVDLATSSAHCGTCAGACAAGRLCAGGVCRTDCPPPGTICSTGTAMRCVDLRTDTANCGRCDRACGPGQVCSAADCACPAGTTLCGAACVDVSSDLVNCGRCGVACRVPTDGAASCTAGVCGITCRAGFHACGTSCASDASVASCGRGCTPCAVPAHATATCDGTACGVRCAAGYEDCDGIASNGCEASLTSTANCGSCGRVCSATAPALPACVAAACDFTCPAGYGRASGGCTCWRPTMSTTITGTGYFQQTDYARITGCAIDRPFNYTYSMTTMTRAIEVTTDGTIMVETRPFGDCQYHPARDSIPTRVVVSSVCGGSFSVSGLPTSGGGFDCTRTNDYSLSIQITGGRIRIVDTCITHYARGDTGRYEAFFDAPAPVIP